MRNATAALRHVRIDLLICAREQIEQIQVGIDGSSRVKTGRGVELAHWLSQRYEYIVGQWNRFTRGAAMRIRVHVGTPLEKIALFMSKRDGAENHNQVSTSGSGVSRPSREDRLSNICCTCPIMHRG